MEQQDQKREKLQEAVKLLVIGSCAQLGLMKKTATDLEKLGEGVIIITLRIRITQLRWDIVDWVRRYHLEEWYKENLKAIGGDPIQPDGQV